MAQKIDHTNTDLFIIDSTRPMWYVAFALISLFDIGMIVLMMLVPDYAALWLAMLLMVTVIGGASYKVNKYKQPLPDDRTHHIGPENQ